MKNIYEVYTFSIDKNGEYVVTLESRYIAGYKQAKELLEDLKRYDDKKTKTEMCKLDINDILDMLNEK